MKWKLLKEDIKNLILGTIFLIVVIGGWIFLGYCLGILYEWIMDLFSPSLQDSPLPFLLGMLTIPFYFILGFSLHNRYSGKEAS